MALGAGSDAGFVTCITGASIGVSDTSSVGVGVGVGFGVAVGVGGAVLVGFGVGFEAGSRVAVGVDGPAGLTTSEPRVNPPCFA